MASEGPRLCTTGANNSAVGSFTWSSPTTGANADGGDTCNCVINPSGQSQYLSVSAFGFSIPSGATIDGIVVEVERIESFGSCYDAAARIVKGGTIGSTDRSSAVKWPASQTLETYGGSSDLWGESWTDTDINASNFGFAISCSSAGFTLPGIDRIRITVYYTATASGNPWYYFAQMCLLAAAFASLPVSPIATIALAVASIGVGLWQRLKPRKRMSVTSSTSQLGVA